MKKILRIFSLLLLLSLVLTMAVSCRDPEDETVPDGMMSANLIGDDFRFYVPTSWNLNTTHGVRGAYYNMESTSTVSLVKYPITDAIKDALPAGGDAEKNAARLDAYRTVYCLPAIQAQITGEISDYKDDTADLLLGGVAARKYHMLASVKVKTENEQTLTENMHFVQVITEKNNAFYVFTFTCVATELYDRLLPDVDKMLQNFVFSDKPYDSGGTLAEIPEDENTPEGMKPAYRKGMIYRFYAPVTWKINTAHNVCSVYYEGDGANVSVVPYIPAEASLSLADYFNLNRAEMERAGGEGSFVLLSEQEIQLDGGIARRYEYTWRIGNTTYWYLQVVSAYRGYIYNITYTAATEENYQLHLADVEAMLAAFAFA